MAWYRGERRRQTAADAENRNLSLENRDQRLCGPWKRDKIQSEVTENGVCAVCAVCAYRRFLQPLHRTNGTTRPPSPHGGGGRWTGDRGERRHGGVYPPGRGGVVSVPGPGGGPVGYSFR